MDLRELADRALKACGDASQAEVFAASGRTVSVYLDDGRIKNVEEKDDIGISLRVLKGRRVGQASSTCSTIEDAERCARAASRLADLAPASKSFDRLPSPSKATLAPNNWDPLVAQLGGSTLCELTSAVAGAAEARGVKVPKGMIRGGAVETLVRNTNGVDAENRYTAVFSDFSSMTSGPQPGEGVASYTSPWLEGLDPYCMGASLAEQAMAAQCATTLPSSLRIPVFIVPDELGNMLDILVGSAASADIVQRKRSPWAGKLGQQVASPEITIVDDPGDPRAVLSAPYDDEGVPTAVRPVVENGVLRSYLYDAYSSSVKGQAPSGNGLRRGPHNSQYVFRGGVSAGHFNLLVSPGGRNREQMLSSFDRCALIEKVSSPDVNPVTGAFALEVRLGHVLEHGTVKSSFKHALVVGNLLEALKSVVAIGRDVQVVRSTILPTIGMEGIEVVVG
jgi:PmbA protein